MSDDMTIDPLVAGVVTDLKRNHLKQAAAEFDALLETNAELKQSIADLVAIERDRAENVDRAEWPEGNPQEWTVDRKCDFIGRYGKDVYIDLLHKEGRVQ